MRTETWTFLGWHMCRVRTVIYQSTKLLIALLRGKVQAPAASSAAPYVNRIHEGNFEAETRNEDALTSISSAIRDDECDTVKGLSEDGHSYAGTVVRGVLRGMSE